MKKYIIYNTDTGAIKSTITTNSPPENDITQGFSYLESWEPVDRKAVCTKTKKLIPVNINLPYQVTALGKFRGRRNHLLYQSDYTQVPDSPLSDTKKAEWATYRQALRDLPQNYPDITSLDEVVWPEMPTSTT